MKMSTKREKRAILMGKEEIYCKCKKKIKMGKYVIRRRW
jgi:hypothetical protein